MERVGPATSLGKLLAWCAQQQATDIHAQADRRHAYRVDGKLLQTKPQQFPIPTNEDINWNRVEMESHGFTPAMPGILKPDQERD